ncbi:MAG: hypothetical protein WDZ91_15410 [Paenibacillaceae bacterium]
MKEKPKEQAVFKQAVFKEKPKEQAVSSLFTLDGKPIRVLSTSLGLMLLANAVMATGVQTKTAFAEGEFANNEPKLIAWSNDDVKAYYNGNVDWSIPNTEFTANDEAEGQNGDSGGTTIVHNSGFGWESMLLYGLLMSRGSAYSSQGWYNDRRGTYTGTNTTYKPRNYSSDTFQNKQVSGSTVRPKTSSTTGSITRRSPSAGKGSIGGRSGGIGSSKSRSGFGG